MGFSRPAASKPSYIFVCMMTAKTSVAPAAVAEKLPVLVVDDEYGPRESIAFSLSGEFAVDTAERARIHGDFKQLVQQLPKELL